MPEPAFIQMQPAVGRGRMEAQLSIAVEKDLALPLSHVKTGGAAMGMSGSGSAVVELGGTSVSTGTTKGELVVVDDPRARFAWDTMSAGAGVLAVQIVAPLMGLPAEKLHWLGAVVGGVYGRHIRRKPS